MLRPLPLVLLLLVAACSDDGGGNSNIVPTLAWGGFRQGPANAAVGNAINRNTGTVRLLIPAPAGGMTLSTAAIDNGGHVYLGTGSGVVSVDSNGEIRWQTSICELPDGTSIPIGPVSSSPTVTPGRTIIVGSDPTQDDSDPRQQVPGRVFALQEDGRDVRCLWAFTPSNAGPGFAVRSSAQVQIDPLDLGLVSVFVGTGDGVFQALNRTGTPRWSVPGSPTTNPRPITSMPAVSTAGAFYVTTPDGLLQSIDGSGRLLWQFAIGSPPEASLMQSPAVAITAFAIGASSAVFGINPDGRLKWQYLPQAPVLGSPAFASQSIDEGSESVFDTVVYIVDTVGTVYGIRDEDGELLEIQRCSGDEEEPCRTDSCLPDNGECDSQTNRCTLEPDEQCTRDTCQVDNLGTCLATEAILPITSGPVRIETSPVVSGDLFAVAGTTDGRLCARNLDNSLPDGTDETTEQWLTGCIELGSTCSLDPGQYCQTDSCPVGVGPCTDGRCAASPGTKCRADSCSESGKGTCLRDERPVRSSPSVGLNDRLYVSTDAGLYVIE
jgi:outer membrane protein assembly factor BamB